MGIIDQVEELERSATPGPLSVGYDGPSRPIIITGDRGVMLALGRLEGGSAHSYQNEDVDARIFTLSRDSLTEVIALVRAAEEAIADVTDQEYCSTCDKDVATHADWCPIGNLRAALDALLRVWGENVEGAKA